MTAVVVDCSVVICWCSEDEAPPFTHAALPQVARHTAAAPALLPLEVANVLATNLRKRRLDERRLTDHVDRLHRLSWELEPHDLTRSLGPILALAQKHGLTSYDAAYLELAKRRALPLAALDHDLATAAQREGVALFRPA